MATDEKDLETIYFEALQRTTIADRAAYLEQVCVENGVRQRVDRLLAAEQRLGDFMEAGALQLVVAEPEPDVGDARIAEQPDGDVPAELERIRDYRLLEEIGRGGMGTVYRALHQRLDKLVAIKLLATERLGPDVVARFSREMKAVGRVDHPNIVRAMDAGEEQGRHFLVTELVDGISLEGLVAEGALEVADVCELIRQAAVGLEHAHRAQMVHRDIKPANLMLSREGVVKILDLGLAMLHEEEIDGGVTQPGQIMGTVDFMAPEQFASSHNVDHRADLYSLGCTMYLLLSGRPPFESDEPVSIYDRLRAHVESTAQPISEIRSDVPPGVSQVVSELMAKSPHARLASAGELASRLAPFCQKADLDSLTGRIAVTSSAADTDDMALAPTRTIEPQSARQSVPPRRHLGRLAVAALVLIAALATVVYFRTGEGTLELTVHDPSASIRIDGKLVKIQPRDGNVITIKLPSGRRQLEVERDGFRTLTRQFRVYRHGNVAIEARLVADKGRGAGSTDQLNTRFVAHPDSVLGLAVSPDGTRLLSAGKDKIVRLWDTENGTLLKEMKGHSKSIHDVCFSPDGKRALSCGEDLSIRHWDLQSGELLMQFTGHSGVVTCARFFPDGKRFATGSYDCTIKVWSVDEATPVRTLGSELSAPPALRLPDDLHQLEAHASWVRSLNFSSDGKFLVSAGNDTLVAVWDMESGKIVQRLIGHRTVVADAQFAGMDGSRVVSAGFDNLAKLWDVETGRVLQEFRGHTAPIQHLVAFDEILITTSQDETARLWNLADGSLVTRIRHPSSIMSLSLDAKRGVLYTGCSNGRITSAKVDDAAKAAESSDL